MHIRFKNILLAYPDAALGGCIGRRHFGPGSGKPDQGIFGCLSMYSYQSNSIILITKYPVCNFRRIV